MAFSMSDMIGETQFQAFRENLVVRCASVMSENDAPDIARR